MILVISHTAAFKSSKETSVSGSWHLMFSFDVLCRILSTTGARANCLAKQNLQDNAFQGFVLHRTATMRNLEGIL